MAFKTDTFHVNCPTQKEPGDHLWGPKSHLIYCIIATHVLSIQYK
jgi:hypothetical protein